MPSPMPPTSWRGGFKVSVGARREGADADRAREFVGEGAIPQLILPTDLTDAARTREGVVRPRPPG